jgi:predicted nuclease of predicted toxin-antitoxin system
MKFLIDAQLPPSLAILLQAKGYDAIHTLSLPNKNLSTDQEINQKSIAERRIVITKDSDFYHSFVLKGEPYKLLIVRVGNMGRHNLNQLLINNLETIAEYFHEGSLVELTTESIKLLS